MADREISSLPLLHEVDDEALFVAELAGKSYRVQGSKIGSGKGALPTSEEMLALMLEGGLIDPATDGTNIYTDADGSVLLL